MTEPSPIDFYFDFSSPYGYLASTRINAIAANHARRVAWRPILLGPMFKAVGTAPLVGMPLKGPYSVRDFARSARYYGVPYAQPEPFPTGTQNAARVFYWINERDPLVACKFAMACYATYFGKGIDITPAEKVADLAEAVGENRAAALATASDPLWKDRLKSENEAALARGVFGSPFIFVGDEPFWGHDRLDQVDAWLARGGF
jgi:2-hydroxychromene-2-carboxylate isomerase